MIIMKWSALKKRKNISNNTQIKVIKLDKKQRNFDVNLRQKVKTIFPRVYATRRIF